MATNKKAWVVGTERIMAWYDTSSERTGCYLFSIMCGKDLIASWTDPDDPEQAGEVLRMSLQAAEENGNSDMLTLRLHKGTDADGYITAKTQAIQSIYVRACPVDQSVRSEYSTRQGDILEEMRLMRQEILELKNGTEEDDEPEGILGTINGWVKDPMIKQAIMGWIMGAIRGGVPGPAPGPMSLAGPNEPQPGAAIPPPPGEDQNQIMRNALTVLWEGNPQLAYDLQRLAKLSKDNPSQYQWLLEMLRKL